MADGRSLILNDKSVLRFVLESHLLTLQDFPECAVIIIIMALDPEFDAEEDAAREIYSQRTSNGWQAWLHGIRSRRRAVTD